MRLTSSRIFRLLVAVAILLTGCAPQRAAGVPTLSQPPVAPSTLGRPLNAADPRAALSLVPPFFVENRGQLDARVGFTVHTSGVTAFFGPAGLTMSLTAPAATGETPDGDLPAPTTDLPQAELHQITRPERPGSQEPGRRWVVRAAFAGAARAVQPVGLEPTEAIVSYFQGRPEDWHTRLRTYAAVAYPELWPGIDLVYGSERGHLKYHFTLQPGAEPGQIRLVWQGATAVRLLENGGLELSTPLGGLVDEPPIAYQEIDGQRVDVPAAFTLETDPATGDSVVGFSVGHYDTTYPLVLDPVMIAYAGYIGGSGDDSAYGIAIDASGSAYVVGITNSSQASFPESVGPDLTFNGGDWDTFVAKVKPDGSGLVYVGYIGGSGSDEGHGIAVDAGGNAYVTGTTTSNQTSFPVTRGPDLTHNGGFWDAFVAKVRPDGSGLVYAGYIGGSGEDFGSGIAVDAGGNAYVTGTTGSDQNSFPVTVGPDLTYGGASDAFVARVKPDGSGLVYAGYIGGSGPENGNGIAIDAAGNAYVVGATGSDQTSFPVTGGPDVTHNGGFWDAFVARVKPDGSGLVYAGYIGGSDDDLANGIAIDAAGNAYVTGQTNSRQTGFPVTVGPDLTFNGGYNDAFVARVKPDGSGLVYAGYIGGANEDFGLGIAVDAAGNAYVAGFTNSLTGFPVTVGPDLTRNGNAYDAFVARVKPDGSSLVYAGYIGGAGDDVGFGIAVDAAGTTYVAGWTGSDRATFPVAVGPDLTYNGGRMDAFVAKVVATDLSPMDDALQQTGVTTAYDPADPRAPAGVYTITGRFKNVSTSTLAHLYFQVTKLTGANVVLNADGGPGAVGAVLSVPATALGSDGRLTPGEEFSQRFEVGLRQRAPFTILVDAYGGTATGSNSATATAGSPGAALLGHALGAFEIPGATPAPTSCAPNVGITSAATGTPGQLRVTVTAKPSTGQPPNALLALAFGPPSNATIDVEAPNGPRAQARAFTYTPPAATQEVVFLLTRQRDGAAFQVSLEATDACGRWSTFAGAGQGFR